MTRALAAAIVAGCWLAAGCGSGERTCGLSAGPESACGEGQVCVCAVARCARFDVSCDGQFRYASGGCVEEAFALSTRPSTPDDHPACAGGGGDADAGEADDGGGVEDGDAPEARADGGGDSLICFTALDCTDHNFCNGIEDCDPDSRLCVDGPPPDEGAPCSSPVPGRCRDGVCAGYECGDRFVDAFLGEECDDGNDVSGDGCEPGCRTTCLEGEACHETPDDPCTVDECIALDPPNLGRTCTHDPVPAGEVCDYRDSDCDGEVDEGTTRAVLAGPLRFTDSGLPGVEPALAWNTSNYLVAWIEDAGGGGGLWARRVTAAGAAMGGAHRVDAAGRARSPDAIWSPTAWAVAWLDERRGGGTIDVRVAVLDTAAVRIGAEQVLTTAAARAAGRPALVWDGFGLGVAWSDERLGADASEIWFARAGADAVPDPAGEVRVTDAAGVSREPRLAWTGAAYALVWIDGQDAAASGEEQVRLVSLDAAGVPLGPSTALTTEARSPRELDLAWSGTRLAVVWTDERAGSDQVYLRTIDAAGAGDPERPLTATTDGASMPAVAWGGFEWTVAWSQPGAGGAEIVAAWYPPPGTPEEGRTAIGGGAAPATRPSLAWSGGGYGLAWVDDADVLPQIYVALIGCAP
ncbi:MAG: hypothetical protein HY905_18885 [Deltaproteobacteria bacterium]|nr:hypothetical protein [Deltaproteobacteria bacterium]